MSTQRFGIALMIIVLFAAVLGYMLWSRTPGTDIMIGALVAAFALAPKWYFDSSPGSEHKTELLAKAQPVVNIAPTPPTPDPGKEPSP